MRNIRIILTLTVIQKQEVEKECASWSKRTIFKDNQGNENDNIDGVFRQEEELLISVDERLVFSLIFSNLFVPGQGHRAHPRNEA